MKFYGKSEDVCRMMIDTFKAGNLPDALTPMPGHDRTDGTHVANPPGRADPARALQHYRGMTS